MEAYLSQYNYVFEITNCGFNGHKIEDIKKLPLNNCSLPSNPHAVILFWGSDCSKVSEYKYSDEEISSLRETYVSNVNFVVNTSLKKGKSNLRVVLLNSENCDHLYSRVLVDWCA